MTQPDLLTAVRDHLISEGVGRDPRVAGPLPPIWREPRDGAPAPGEKEGDEDDPTQTISLFDTGGITPSIIEQQHFVRPTIDVVIRTDKPPTAKALQEAITTAMIFVPGEPAQTPAMNFFMGALRILSVQVWREWQPLDYSEQAYTAVGSFEFDLGRAHP